MAKTIDLLLANRQQMAKNIPDDEVDFLEKNPFNIPGFSWLCIR